MPGGVVGRGRSPGSSRRPRSAASLAGEAGRLLHRLARWRPPAACDPSTPRSRRWRARDPGGSGARAVPEASTPWQLEQFSSNRIWPCAMYELGGRLYLMVPDVPGPASAPPWRRWPRGGGHVVAPWSEAWPPGRPTRPTSATRRPPRPPPTSRAAGGHTKPFRRSRGPRGSTGLQEEQAAEDADPHEVDEVPVIADGLEHIGLAGVALFPPMRPSRKIMATRPRATWRPWMPVMTKNRDQYGVGRRPVVGAVKSRHS